MMPARTFFLCLAFACGPALADGEARIVIQHSALAGFRYYDGRVLWSGIKVGDPLILVREPDNPHDANAIRVEWQGQKLGYVPRRDNAALARQMDRGAAVAGRITELHGYRNGRKRVSYEVSVPLRQPAGQRIDQQLQGGSR
jgi:hypothetical protein